jgi:hypothetical protein
VIFYHTALAEEIVAAVAGALPKVFGQSLRLENLRQAHGQVVWIADFKRKASIADYFGQRSEIRNNYQVSAHHILGGDQTEDFASPRWHDNRRSSGKSRFEFHVWQRAKEQNTIL